MRHAGTYAPFIVLLVVLAYWPSVRVPFVLDDATSIVQNAAIRSPVTLASLLTTPRPVVAASFALNHAIGNLSVTGYHVVNLLAHLLCGVLVFGLARFTFRLPRLASHSSAADALALATSALFLLHPVQTETVTYVVQRGESLATAAMLALVWMGAAAARTPRPGRLLVGMAVVGVLGVLTKPVVAGVVVVSAAYDFCLLGTSWWRPRRRLIVYGTLVAIGVAGGLWAARWQSDAAGFRAHDLSAWGYAAWQPAVVVGYLSLLAWPRTLCFDCGLRAPWPIMASWLGRAPLAAAALLATGIIGAVAIRRRAPLAAFAVLGTLASLLPTSSVIPLADVWVEHRLYLSVAWWAMLVAGAGHTAMRAVTRRGWLTARSAGMVGIAGIGALCIVLAATTTARNRVWTDEVRLWRDSLATAPANPRVHYNLGNALAQRGDREGAIASLREAARLDPGLAMAWVNLGNQLLLAGDTAGAVEAFRTALDRDPTLTFVYRNLAVALIRLERGDEALAALEAAVGRNPDDALSQRLRGDLLLALGRPADARQAYAAVLRLDPGDAHARERLTALGGSP